MCRFLIFIIIFSSCKEIQTVKEETTNLRIDDKDEIENKQQIISNFYHDEIDYYLHQYQLEPLMIINNQDKRDNGGWEIKKDLKFQLLNHNVQWKRNDSLQIIVNGHKINEKPYTVNNLFKENNVDNIDFANDVEQVKYYKLNNGTEILSFLLRFSPCTGKGCGIQYFLLYDIKKKKGTYFGDFRRRMTFELYDFNQSPDIECLSQTYYQNYSADVDTFKYELYRHQKNGYFKPVFNPKNNEIYNFKHIYSSFRDTIPHSLEENWIEPIIRNK